MFLLTVRGTKKAGLARPGFGSLLLAYYAAGGKLTNAGRISIGFDASPSRS